MSPLAGAGLTVTVALPVPVLVVLGSPFWTVMLVTFVGVLGVSVTVTAPAGTRIGRLQCPIGTVAVEEKPLLPEIPKAQLPVRPESDALFLHTST